MTQRPAAPTSSTARRIDTLIVGAGISGIYMLHRLRGLDISARVVDAASGIGGTWHWNRYPGARCDIESVEYQYAFSEELMREWTWSERYATQPEILRYLNHVVDRFDLRRDIQLDTRVTSAVYDDAAGRWTVTTDRGEVISARACVMATGCLSTPRTPAIPGLDSFAGPHYHTGTWPAEGVDRAGKRVAVIGTGSSGIQMIPEIAGVARQLFVFQRTPNFSIPAHNAPLSPEVVASAKAGFAAAREKARASYFGVAIDVSTVNAVDATPEDRARTFEARWQDGGLGFAGSYGDLIVNRDSNDLAAAFVRDKIRAQVRDPATAAALTPSGYPLAAKRLCVDTSYYATFNRENVELIDVRANPIEAITADGVRTRDAAYPVDVIVFATGFDAMTGAVAQIDLRGRGGVRLAERWAGGPRTYLGLMVAGFPNLFLIAGPGSPSVISNMVVSIEQHVDWVADCLAYQRKHAIASIEPREDAEQAWTAHVAEVAGYTLYPQADSWYVGANIPGKPRGILPYLGGVGAYRAKCDEVAAAGYDGFVLHRAT